MERLPRKVEALIAAEVDLLKFKVHMRVNRQFYLIVDVFLILRGRFCVQMLTIVLMSQHKHFLV